MSKIIINNCSFIISAAKCSQLPETSEPEIAFIGRSNAGKSTLINRLVGQKSLAKVSSKPGKTRLLNLFELNYSASDQANSVVNLVDLPGYGYAKASKGIREQLAKLVIEYFQNRQQLKTVFLLSDCKRTVDEMDVELRDFLFEQGITVQVILTKTDKLNQKDLNASKIRNAKALGLEPSDLLLSSLKKPAEHILVRMLDSVG